MFNLVINSNNVANSLNNSYEYKFKNGNFTIAEGSQIMITSLQIPRIHINLLFNELATLFELITKLNILHIY